MVKREIWYKWPLLSAESKYMFHMIVKLRFLLVLAQIKRAPLKR